MSGGSSLKERVVHKLLNAVVSLVNRRTDVRGMQSKYDANRGRVCRMRVTDVGKDWFIRVLDGRLEFVREPVDVAGGFDISSEVLIALALGKRTYMNPATGVEFVKAFSPLDAVTFGEVNVWGDAVSNDLLLITRHIFQEVQPQLKEGLSVVGRGG